MTLTARQIEAAKPQDKPYKIADGGGLYLYIAPTGLRSWRANYQQDGKQKTRTYGRYPDMTLSQARIAATVGRNFNAKRTTLIATLARTDWPSSTHLRM